MNEQQKIPNSPPCPQCFTAASPPTKAWHAGWAGAQVIGNNLIDTLRQRLAEVEAITDNLRAERLREFDRAERNHADANRYRYLRVDGVPQLCVVVNGVPSYIDDPDGSSLDAFIDAAIEADAAIDASGEAK